MTIERRINGPCVVACLLPVVWSPAALALPGPAAVMPATTRDARVVLARGFGWGGRHWAHRERKDRSSKPARQTTER